MGPISSIDHMSIIILICSLVTEESCDQQIFRPRCPAGGLSGRVLLSSVQSASERQAGRAVLPDTTSALHCSVLFSRVSNPLILVSTQVIQTFILHSTLHFTPHCLWIHFTTINGSV